MNILAGLLFTIKCIKHRINASIYDSNSNPVNNLITTFVDKPFKTSVIYLHSACLHIFDKTYALYCTRCNPSLHSIIRQFPKSRSHNVEKSNEK